MYQLSYMKCVCVFESWVVLWDLCEYLSVRISTQYTVYMFIVFYYISERYSWQRQRQRLKFFQILWFLNVRSFSLSFSLYFTCTSALWSEIKNFEFWLLSSSTSSLRGISTSKNLWSKDFFHSVIPLLSELNYWDIALFRSESFPYFLLVFECPSGWLGWTVCKTSTHLKCWNSVLHRRDNECISVF